LLLAMLGLSIGGAFVPAIPPLFPAAFAWGSALLLWPGLGRARRRQVLILATLGIAGLALGVTRGVAISSTDLLAQNQGIISMLAAVSFLRLLDHGLEASDTVLPVGVSAYRRTTLGVHLFGALINVSALTIIGDRLARSAPLSEAEALYLCRAFTMAVFYSPFIGGMALALSYTPGSDLGPVAAGGIPLALAGLGLLWLLPGLRALPDGTRGYPVHFESLWLPGLLAASVLVVHRLLPILGILALVTTLCPLLVAITLCLRQGPRRAGAEMWRFSRSRLPDLASELTLFLSAGVLGAGLTALLRGAGVGLPFAVFTATQASWLLAGIVAICAVGVHPVVLVTTAAVFLAPLEPDPNLVALLFVAGWGIGCTICPLSGTNLTLAGRYGIDNWRLARRNILFCAAMTGTACVVFHLFELLAGGTGSGG
jgi:hypothetical protein